MIVQHVIQIENGIMKRLNVSVKIIISSRKVIVGTRGNVFAKMVNILKVLPTNW